MVVFVKEILTEDDVVPPPPPLPPSISGHRPRPDGLFGMHMPMMSLFS